MRIFIALPIDNQMQRQIIALQSKLAALSNGGRFVPSENFHVTMHFIGESDRIDEATLALKEAVRGIHPFTLGLNEYGYFSRGAGKTAFVSLRGDIDALNRLHESLEAALEAHGFGRDSRPLKAHITLARDVIHSDAVTHALRQEQLDAHFVTNTIVLYRSKRVRERMVYTPLHTEKI